LTPPLLGFAGIFAKAGLSGLPLPLTLGAFIGSYVQRSVSERIASGEQVLSPRPPGGPGRERV